MSTEADNAAKGIAFILLGMVAITINDVLIKFLSGGYPLHQLVFIRSGVGLVFILALVRLEGGWHMLRVDRPALHILRGLLVVVANMTYFAALAVLPLAEAVALFFVAPLFITLLSIPLLRERVGPWRLGAVAVGFVGVLVMQRPWAGDLNVPRLVLLLPVVAAFTYALMQILTRRLGVTAKASVLAVWIQSVFLVVSALFGLVAGDGRFAEGAENDSLIFLFRAWIWPAQADWGLLALLGANSAVIGYSLSSAYRSADAGTIAPFEYVALPLAILAGWLVFAELPGPTVWLGTALIGGAGLVVFLRERQRGRAPVTRAGPRRRY
ncbi:DMT family transporter [Rhodosalinus sp.]|uniref:DMT family transporter n=1 Tax=Rhodosalinus sp. TaxID=2047741 RepID=UPI00397D7666